MGNGPGGLWEYQELFERHPRCQGGFVWEWIDHGIRQRTGDGREFFAYGGDFDEPLHDGNFVADGLLFPDRTPSPGLLEYKKVLEPVRIEARPGGGIRITNLHQFKDLSHLAFQWTLELDGEPVASGGLEAPELPQLLPAETITVALPSLPETASGSGLAAGAESWLTVRAVLANDELWSDAGHEVAWGQIQVGTGGSGGAPAGGSQAPDAAQGPVGVQVVVASRPGQDGRIELGPGVFDAADGRLMRLGDVNPVAVDGPRLDVWRAPTDNDRAPHGEAVEPLWRAVGLHRVQHRIDAVDIDDDGCLVVRTRVAPAATDLGLRTTYRWSAAAGGLRLVVEVVPEGEWPCPLPRLGLRMAVPTSLENVEWFGRGPSEAYADTGRAARVGRFTASVASFQTPYVYPQENGNRADVRWATITDGQGRGLRVRGEPTIDLTVRPWTSEQLDQARHPIDLVWSDRLWVNLDLAQQGIGSASCGPGVLPAYRLDPAPMAFSVLLDPMPGP